MTKSQLLIRLRDLHEQLEVINDDLAAAPKVDDETVEALGQLVTDVGGLVDRANQIVDENEEPPASHSLMDRIQEFESEHPRVTRILSDLTDLIASIGI